MSVIVAHRTDNRNLHNPFGPARIYEDGATEWWINGALMSFNNYCQRLNLSPEQELELRLKYL